MKSKFKYTLFIFWLLGICQSIAQDGSQTQNLKNEINELKAQNDIISINQFINSNNSLEPEYVLKTLTENLKYAKTIGKTKEISHTYNALGNFWLLQSNRIKSYENYLQAKFYSQKINDGKLTGTILLNLANVTEDREEQINLYKQVIEIFEKNNDRENLSKAYLNLGNTYVTEYWQASEDSLSKKEILSYYKKKAIESLKMVEKINGSAQNSVAAVVNIYYGQLYKYEKNLPKAESYFKKAENLSSKINNVKTLTYCKLHLANIAMKKNESQKALELLQTAEQFSEKYNYNEYLSGVYELYIQLYTHQNNLPKALEYSEKHKESIVKLNELISRDKIHALNLEYSLAENEFKMEQYEAKSKLNRILLIVIVLIAIFIAGISYLIIQNKKRKIDSIEKTKVITELEKSAIEIKLKNQLLEDELLKEKIMFSQNHLMTFANLSNRIQFFLDELKLKVKKLPNGQETQEEVNSLKMKFSEILNNQNQFTQLNTMSNQLNQDFFFHIRQNYPNISKEDEQLLAFIILDLTSKEISSNLNISSESVYKKRYRLRKKLNLENETTFQDFYENVLSSISQN